MEAANPLVKPTFEEAYPEIQRIVASRRSNWTYLSIEPWEEIRSLLIIRIWKQYGKYDPAKGSLEHWANRLISNALMNLKRNNGRRLQKPCVGGGKSNGKSCVYNLGGDSCSYTPTGRQCAECPLYAKWQRERENQLHIKAPVALENHAQEVSNVQCDFIDIAGIRDQLYTDMLKELTRWEGRVFRLTIMKGVPPAKASEILAAEIVKRKRPPGPSEKYSYTAVLIMNRMFRGMMKVILRRAGHID